MSIYLNDSSKNKKNGKSEKLKNINAHINTSINLYNLSQNYLNNKYGTNSNNLKYKYLGLIMENLIFNKNSHLVTVFKDYMILDYIEELLKRYYLKKESFERLPKFAVFYKNYLKFFCLPLIKESFSNNLIHNRFEKKAEFFYNENYKNKKNNNNSSEQDIGLCEDSESSTPSENKNNSNNRIDKTLFSKTIRKKIEKYSPINTSMTLPENGSNLKKDDSGLLITYSNENSLHNLVKELDINKLLNKNKNNKKTKTQSLEHKKVSKKIKNNKSLLNDNNKNNNYLGLSKENNDINANEEKLFENIKANKSNFENANIKIIKNNKNQFGRNDSYKIKKFETQTLKILLNNNYNGLFNSKSCKKLVKNGGLWKLLKNKENMSKDIDDNIITINNNKNNNNNNNKQNLLNAKNKNKNKILSYIDAFKKKSIPKSGKSKFSIEEINKNFIKNKIHHSKNINNINNENLSNKYASNSKNGSFGKINNMKKKSCKITLSKKNINMNNNNTNNKDKNQLESIINKIQANAFNSIKKMASRNKKILLKKDSKNSINITRNSNTNNNIYMNKNSYFGLTSNFTNSNIKYENGIIPNLYNNISATSNLKLRSNSHNDKNGYSSSSSIFDLVEKSKSKKEIDKICNINIYNTNLNKKNSNNLYKGIFQIDELKNNNNVHNVNININNQINVGINNLNDLKTFSGNKKKNKVQRKIIYRNQNRNEFNTINQNIINNNDYQTSYADDKKNKEKPNLLNKNKLTNQKNAFNNNNNLKLINHYLFRSFKTINNNKI